MYINHITSLVAPALIPLSELSELYGWGERNDKIFSRFHHLKSASLFPDTSLPVLMQALFSKLHQECEPELLEKIDGIVWAHSLHSVTPFDNQQLTRIFAKRETECFSVTQASCASGLVALQFIKGKLAGAKWRCGLLITAEKCFHRTVQYVDQNGFFGEGLTATVVSAELASNALKIKALQIKQLAAFSNRMRATTRENENRYDRAFLPTMHDAIRQSLLQANCQAGELDYVLPYHISPVTFNRLADQVGFDRSIIFKKNLFTLGHCFCSDAFINLNSLILQAADDLKGKSVLCLASGVAGTFATMIIKSETEVSA